MLHFSWPFKTTFLRVRKPKIFLYLKYSIVFCFCFFLQYIWVNCALKCSSHNFLGISRMLAWILVKKTFYWIIVLQSRVQGLYSCWKNGTHWTESFYNLLDLGPWIGGQCNDTLKWILDKCLSFLMYV